jgi:hypothetical protein
MKKLLRLLSLWLALSALFLWAATGANLGWTKTSVPSRMVDEVTGIEGVVYEKRFMPGVELLGAALILAAALAAGSLAIRKKQPQKPNPLK